MANLTIKPASVSDTFTFTDANATPNTILTVEGQTEGGAAANLLGGRIIYGRGVNETKGTCTQASAIITLDLATGTFFDITLSANVSTWKILHLPQTDTVAAWVVRIENTASNRTVAWAGDAGSTYDTNADPVVFAAVTTAPAFHWASSEEPTITVGANKVDVISFWTFGGAVPVIYSSATGQNFST